MAGKRKRKRKKRDNAETLRAQRFEESGSGKTLDGKSVGNFIPDPGKRNEVRHSGLGCEPSSA